MFLLSCYKTLTLRPGQMKNEIRQIFFLVLNDKKQFGCVRISIVSEQAREQHSQHV